MKILIVDDHDLFSEGLKLLIENLRPESSFTLARNFAGGIAYLKTSVDEASPYDLILLDFNLPDKSGEPSISAFCEAAGSCPVVVVSSEDSRDKIRMAIGAGASGFIPKSSSKDILIGALDHVLSGGTFLPKQVLNTVDDDKLPRKLNRLTPQQQKILSFVVKGVSNKVIASQLEIAEGTVKAHLHSAFKTLEVNNRTEAVLAVAKHKITFDEAV